MQGTKNNDKNNNSDNNIQWNKRAEQIGNARCGWRDVDETLRLEISVG